MVAWEALDALSHQLELCKIDTDSRVVVLLDSAVDPDRASLIRAAVARTGAEAVEVQHIGRRARGASNALLSAAIDVADIIVVTAPDLVAALDQIDQQILVLAPLAPHTFAPHANLQRRVTKLSTLVGSAQQLHIADRHGTDLTVELAGAGVGFDHGVVTAEHRKAQFPAGWVSVVPTAHRVHGDLVLMPGDGNQSAERLFKSPVRLHIINDHISAIEGESADADILRSQLEYAGDPAAFGVAEFSVGMNPGAAATGPFDDRVLHPVVGRLLAGLVGISFGENLHADRPCSQQIGLALRDRTVTIDDLPVVVAGVLDGDLAPDVYEL